MSFPLRTISPPPSPLLSLPPLVPDSSSLPFCTLCGCSFSWLRRRHHCRCCGFLFCDSCSQYFVDLKIALKIASITSHNEPQTLSPQSTDVNTNKSSNNKNSVFNNVNADQNISSSSALDFLAYIDEDNDADLFSYSLDRVCFDCLHRLRDLHIVRSPLELPTNLKTQMDTWKTHLEKHNSSINHLKLSAPNSKSQTWPSPSSGTSHLLSFFLSQGSCIPPQCRPFVWSYLTNSEQMERLNRGLYKSLVQQLQTLFIVEQESSRLEHHQEQLHQQRNPSSSSSSSSLPSVHPLSAPIKSSLPSDSSRSSSLEHIIPLSVRDLIKLDISRTRLRPPHWLDKVQWESVYNSDLSFHPHLIDLDDDSDRRPEDVSLSRLLHAYALFDPSTGYHQGMSFIALACLLTLRSEEASFWAFVQVMNSYCFKFVFRTGHSLLSSWVAHALKQLTKMDPELIAHFESHRFDVIIFPSKWFRSLFLGENISWQMACRLVDFFLIEGPDALVKLFLSLFLFESNRKSLMLASGMIELTKATQSLLESLETYSKELFELASSFASRSENSEKT